MMKRIIALLLALILTVGLLPTVALAADEVTATKMEPVVVEDSGDNTTFRKTISENDDGSYKVTLEAWATGKTIVEETKIPLDIVLVLDKSGSMEETFSTKSETIYRKIESSDFRYNEYYWNWSADNIGLWYKVGEKYYKVNVDRSYDARKVHFVYTYTYQDSNGQMQTIGTSTRRYRDPGYDFYRKEVVNSTTTKMDALKEAATSFATTVQKKAAEDKLEHRIAVVSYSTDAYIATGSNAESALVEVNKGTGLETVKNAINKLEADGGTQIDLGIKKANEIFEANEIEEGKRTRVVIAFTDGTPGLYGYWAADGKHGSNYFNTHKTADDAIQAAYSSINTYKASVYTIGIFDGADNATLPNYTKDAEVKWDYDRGKWKYVDRDVAAQAVANSNRFMHLVSSNYPTAKGMEAPGKINSELGENSFYLAASSAGELSEVFDAIGNTISTVTTTLNDKATIVDKVPSNFTISANAENISLKVANCIGENNGALTFATPEAAPEAVKAKRQGNTVRVNGFNFSDKWCGKENDAYRGQKLIVSFDITHNNYGGTQPTNDGACIKDASDESFIDVDNPSIPVKITEPSITGATATKVYVGEGIDVLANVAAEADKLVTGENKGKNAFVNIIVKVKDANNVEYTYTIPAGATTGSWDRENVEFKTPADVKIESDGSVGKYSYDLSIIYQDKAQTNPAAPKTVTGKAEYTITKRPVTLRSETASKSYDGNPLTKPEVTVTDYNDGKNVFNSEFTAAATGTITEPGGPVANTITVTPKNGALESNYEITKKEGKLTITQDETTKITVTITGKNTSKEYDGTEHVAEGYDVSVSGANANDVSVSLNTGKQAKANGTDVKSEGNGEYRMGLTKDDFTVTSNKYKKIEVTYIDGYVKITPAQVTLTSETASKDYDGTPLTKPDVTVGGTGANVFRNEVTNIKAIGSVTDPSEGEVNNTITYTKDAAFKDSNYSITEIVGKLSINSIAAPTNLPTVTVHCTNGVANHPESTGNTLKNNTYTSVVSKNAEGKYICTISLTDKSSYISDYNDSTAATHTSDSTQTDFTVIVLYYDTVNKAWPTPIVNFALYVKCDTPTVTVTYTWDGFDMNDFDENYPLPTKPGDATPNKGSDYTVDPTHNNSSIAIGKDGVRYKFSGWSTSNATIKNGQIKSIQNDVTLTGHWTKVNAFDLNEKIYKSFTAKTGSNPIPEAGDLTYNFGVTVESLQEAKENSRYGSVELTTGTTDDVPFNFNNVRYLTFDAKGIYTFSVKETSSYTSGSTAVKGTITNDTTEYLLTIQVDETLNVVAYSFVEMPAGDTPTETVPTGEPTITFENKYNEDPNADDVTLDLSKYVTKIFESRHGKSATETFKARVEIWVKNPEVTVTAAEENAIAVYDSDPVNGTVVYDEIGTVTLSTGEKASFTFATNPKLNRKYDYAIRVTEVTGNNTDVEYDKTVYESRFGFIYDTKEIEWLEGTSNFSFTNTYTGIDDYYPIIIPTIINKDTGMLNKTDHFAYVIGYPDGTVHPNGQITRAEVATIFFRLLRDEVRDGAFTTSNTYSDVAYGKWYNNPISTMSALGIITGYPDGTFKPNKPITRAEFAAIAARFDETQSGKSATFSDVIGHWAAKEIGIAYYNDWIKGYPDGTFKPDQNITRAEAMTLINRVLERKPESPADLLTNMNKWTDNMDTSKWYYLDVQEATNSHGYTRKTFNYELWRQMLPDPDWSRYER